MLNIIEFEEWKEIKDTYGYYYISNLGRVKNKKGLILKTFINNCGYECVKLSHKKVKKLNHTIHRLVAEYFCSKKSKETNEVNHMDGNKLHNFASNLEWVTSSENKLHAFKTGLRTKESCISTLGKKHKSKASKYHNVSFDKNRNKWIGGIRHNGKNYYQKRFNTEIEAAKHVNWILDTLDLHDRPRNKV